jgi:hypothetical protein
MTSDYQTYRQPTTCRRFAAMGAAYGNVPALAAALRDAFHARAEVIAFLGDAIGCCGRSDAAIELVNAACGVVISGNLEQQALRDHADGRPSGPGLGLAVRSLSDENRARIAEWPEMARIPTVAGDVLVCHGSPERTDELLYESAADELRLSRWLEEFQVAGLVCTHTGLPWVRHLPGGTFAVNCGAVGKPDHDGDPAVHYALIEVTRDGLKHAAIRRVVYDHEAFARELERDGIADVFTEPLRLGAWRSRVAAPPRDVVGMLGGRPIRYARRPNRPF